jgi:hypothetical protein
LVKYFKILKSIEHNFQRKGICKLIDLRWWRSHWLSSVAVDHFWSCQLVQNWGNIAFYPNLKNDLNVESIWDDKYSWLDVQTASNIRKHRKIR